jgi:hypothetical protein
MRAAPLALFKVQKFNVQRQNPVGPLTGAFQRRCALQTLRIVQ